MNFKDHPKSENKADQVLQIRTVSWKIYQSFIEEDSFRKSTTWDCNIKKNFEKKENKLDEDEWISLSSFSVFVVKSMRE